MNEWRKRGVEEGIEFAELTAIIAKETFGITPTEHAGIKGLEKENLRDHMTKLELLVTSLGEEMTRQGAIRNDAQGFEAHKEVAIQGGAFAGKMRETLERKEKIKVISPINFLQKDSDNYLT